MKALRVYPFLTVFAILMVMTACNKNEVPAPVNKSLNEIQVPAGFNWESTREITLTITHEVSGMTGALARIRVYDAPPSEQGNVIANGSAGSGFPWKTTLRIPNRLTKLYLEYQDGKGGYQLTSIDITSASLSYTFGDLLKNGSMKSSLTDPDCTSGCDQVISGSGAVVIKNGLTYCVTDNFTGTVTFEYWNGGGTLKVCGSAYILNYSVKLYENCSIMVTDGGSISFYNNIEMNENSTIIIANNSSLFTGDGAIKLNSPESKLINYGLIHIGEGGIIQKGIIENYGSIGIHYYLMESPGYLINFSNIYVSGITGMKINSMTNEGIILCNGNIRIYGQPVLNNCQLISHSDIILYSEGFICNSGYLKAYECVINENTNPVLNNKSMWSLIHLTIKSGTIFGEGGLNSIITGDKLSFLNNSIASGAIEFFDNDSLIYGNQYSMTNGARLVSYENLTNFIPISPCNPEGIGNPSTTDIDYDGVPDNLDDFPLDPIRAYNNYYPNNMQWGTLAFEDHWPSKGDYDFNDLVTDYQFNMVTNAQNKVVDIKARFHVKAVGASFQNGFGLQIDGLSPNMVASVTGMQIEESYIQMNPNGLEANQAKAVIIPWDNAENVINRAGGSMFNTLHNGFTGTADTVNINLLLSVPQETFVIGTPPFNPFLIRERIRGHEIHLPDHMPTSLMNITLFGSISDASIPATGVYYKTVMNLPWGINVPEPLNWMLEKYEITQGYLHLQEWAESAGILYSDWYQNKLNYRDDTKLY